MKDSYDLWLSQVSESEGTSRRYLVDIRAFESWAQEEHGQTVKDLPAKWREAKYKNDEAAKERFLDDLKDIIGDYFAHLKRAALTPLSINRRMAVVMSFLHHFEIPVKPLRIKHPYIQFHNRDITKPEFKEILYHSDVRNRAMFLFLYESGIRPDTLTRLKWKHIKKDFASNTVPTKIELTPDILKCRVSERFTFIGSEGFEALKTYLKPRLPLKDEDLVFVTEKPYGEQLQSTAISQSFNKMVKRLKLSESRGSKPKELRAYCLRKAFRKFMAAEIDQRYVEFWLGHSNTETHYLSQDPEHHRKLYAKGYDALRISPQSPDLKELQKQRDEQAHRIEKLEQELKQQKELLYQLATAKWKASSPEGKQEDVDEYVKLLDTIAKNAYPNTYETLEERLARHKKETEKKP